MKHLFLLVLIILITSTVSIGQMQKAISTKSKSVKFRTTRIEKWGVKSLDLPSEFVASEEMSEPHKNKDITWIQYSRSWGKPLKNKLSSFDADFSVTTWNTDFAKVLGLSSEFATPENILAVENSGSERRKNSGEEPVEETGTLEVSGLKGNFFSRSIW